MSFRVLLILLIGACGLSAQRLPEDFDPDRAAREGRALTQELLHRIPSESFTNTGTILIKERNMDEVEIPARFMVLTSGRQWKSVYETTLDGSADAAGRMTIVHNPGSPSRYYRGGPEVCEDTPTLEPDQVATLKFADSDFWVCDLGLEFLRWPVQRLLKKEIKRSQSCNVLESINPDAPPGGYSRVVSWLDIDTGGVVQAMAYDTDGKPMKEFIPKRFKKVDGEWHLIEMRIEDRRTRSKTRIIFDVDAD